MENLVEHEYSGTTLFANLEEFTIGIKIVKIKSGIATIKTSINGDVSDRCKVKEGATINIINPVGRMEIYINKIKYGEIIVEIPQETIFSPKKNSLLEGDGLELIVSE